MSRSFPMEEERDNSLPVRWCPKNFALKLLTNNQTNIIQELSPVKYWSVKVANIPKCWYAFRKCHYYGTYKIHVTDSPDDEKGIVLNSINTDCNNQRLSCWCCSCQSDRNWVAALLLVHSKRKLSCDELKSPMTCSALLISYCNTPHPQDTSFIKTQCG